MNTTYQWKNGETAVTVPSTITPETVVIDKNENENAKAKAFTLASETNVADRRGIRRKQVPERRAVPDSR